MPTTSLKDVEQQACALSVGERAQLAEVLLESLQAPLAGIQSAWAEEIEQRVTAYDCGDAKAYPESAVFSEARRLCR